MITNIGYGTYFVFAACTTLSIPFVWFMIPETKGLKLEEVDALFNGRGLIHRSRKSLAQSTVPTEQKVMIEQIESV